jgi:hypothetical protein
VGTAICEAAIARSVDVLRDHGASRGEIERELAWLLGEFRAQREEIARWMVEMAADVAAGPSSAKH